MKKTWVLSILWEMHAKNVQVGKGRNHILLEIILHHLQNIQHPLNPSHKLQASQSPPLPPPL